MSRLTSITLLLIFTNCSLVASQPARPDNTSRGNVSDTQTIPSLSYCALVKSPKLYAGKLVRIKAIWQFGFETTFLQSRDCSEQPQAWLEFADEKALCPETKENRNAPGQSDKEADVTAVGRLYGPGRYGHLGDFQFKFVVVCLENIKVASSER